MRQLKAILQTGVSQTEPAEKRNVILTNYISLVAAFAVILLLTGRFLFLFIDRSIIILFLVGAALFLLPILLNRFGFINVSRVALCWLPSFYLLYASVIIIEGSPIIETSHYVGVRLFTLAFSCLPFLVFDMKRIQLFILGLAGPLLSLFLFDPVLNILGYGYYQIGLDDQGYLFNNVRIFISFLIIGASSYMLKRLIEKNEKTNEQLIYKLDQRNKVIQVQAKDALLQLNQQLEANLHELREREFILNQSQKVAKIGSWEYKMETGRIFLSEEMYNIFGLARGFDLTVNNLLDLLSGEQGEVLSDATRKLLATGQSFDLTVQTKVPAGLYKWVRIYAFPIKLDEKIIGVTGVCHDITFYKEAEAKIKLSELKFRALFEQASDAIFTMHKDVITDCNRAALRIFRCSRADILNRTIYFFSPPFQAGGIPSLEAAQEKINAALDDKPQFYEWRHIRLDGTPFEAEVSLNRLSFSNKVFIQAIVRDVTERKATERGLAEANAKIGDLKLMALRSAMNPHFIFNVLNSIQYYIANNDTQNAIDYLSTFSKLIRSILTHSVNNRINLEHEIEMIKNYVALEQARFENKFLFNLEIDPSLEIADIEIPSLLIQPYLENAIIHGLYNKKSQGILTLRIHEDGDAVLFEIEDNGIGREAASRLRATSAATIHKSMGMHLTEERLKLINEPEKVSFEITDLKDASGPSGTLVRIWVKT